jgi:hypothetical protein
LAPELVQRLEVLAEAALEPEVMTGGTAAEVVGHSYVIAQADRR